MQAVANLLECQRILRGRSNRVAIPVERSRCGCACVRCRAIDWTRRDRATRAFSPKRISLPTGDAATLQQLVKKPRGTPELLEPSAGCLVRSCRASTKRGGATATEKGIVGAPTAAGIRFGLCKRHARPLFRTDPAYVPLGQCRHSRGRWHRGWSSSRFAYAGASPCPAGHHGELW